MPFGHYKGGAMVGQFSTRRQNFRDSRPTYRFQDNMKITGLSDAFSGWNLVSCPWNSVRCQSELKVYHFSENKSVPPTQFLIPLKQGRRSGGTIKSPPGQAARCLGCSGG